MPDLVPAPVTVGGDQCPLIERHRGWLSRLITARVGVAEVDDVLQEVALAVARSDAAPDAAEGERPWLCVIAIRQCALALRKLARRARLVSRVAGNAVPDARLADDPLYWLVCCETRSLVRDALAELPAAQREILLWKYVDGLTYPDLASQLGVTRHVAEYQVVLAKRALRLAFVNVGLDEESAR